MSHIGTSDESWANAKVCNFDPGDLFRCESCDIEFGVCSKKIIGKKVKCPLCQKSLTPWRTGWMHY